MAWELGHPCLHHLLRDREGQSLKFAKLWKSHGSFWNLQGQSLDPHDREGGTAPRIRLNGECEGQSLHPCIMGGAPAPTSRPRRPGPGRRTPTPPPSSSRG